MKQDKIIRYIIEKASDLPQIKKVILFGSRARGDHQSRSDYDIAVEFIGTIDPINAWLIETKENAPTLCGLDIVLLQSEISTALRNAIKNEGIVIYEQKK